MQKTAQKSQQKSGNLGNGEAVYAFKTARINPENLSVRFWTLGGVIRRFNMACSEVPALVEQIDSALADGDFCLWFDSARYSVPEKLLRGIRENLLVLASPTANGAIHSLYNAVSGGSDAHVVRGGVSTPRKSKASARADGGSVPEASSFSGIAGSVGRQLSNDEVARIVGEELRKAVMPVLAEIDAITALVKECAAELAAVSKQFITRAPGEFGGQATPPAPRRKGGRDSCCPKAGRVNAEGSIFTRRGRTSVVVGRRKVS
ncbi:MAG: hypothetical protein J6J65_00435 [Opitutales bacterium]|nr:hypothetical protein [Opitutales bacterium]